MGVELNLLPFFYEDSHGGASLDVLRLTRRSNLFSEIEDKIEMKEVPDTFDTHLSSEEIDGLDETPHHFGNTQNDDYGHPLKWCFVKDLMELSDHPGVQDNPRNKAIWAYLNELPDKKKVALHWS